MKQDLILRGCRSFPGRIHQCVQTLREILSFCTHYSKTGCFAAKVCWLEISPRPVCDCDTDDGYWQGIVIGYM